MSVGLIARICNPVRFCLSAPSARNLLLARFAAYVCYFSALNLPSLPGAVFISSSRHLTV